MNGRTTAGLRRLAGAGEPELARQLDRLFSVIATAAADSPSFAKSLADALHSGSCVPRPTEPSQTRRAKNRRDQGPFDPFVLLGDGEEALRIRLESCSVEQLKDIVAEHGMDYDRLALRWKDPSRLIERIMETTAARARKGEAFRSAQRSAGGAKGPGPPVREPG